MQSHDSSISPLTVVRASGSDASPKTLESCSDEPTPNGYHDNDSVNSPTSRNRSTTLSTARTAREQPRFCFRSSRGGLSPTPQTRTFQKPASVSPSLSPPSFGLSGNHGTPIARKFNGDLLNTWATRERLGINLESMVILGLLRRDCYTGACFENASRVFRQQERACRT